MPGVYQRKERIMKLNERGFTDFYHFPAEETDAVMERMAKAEITDNLADLKRCARLLKWLYDVFKDDTCGSDEPFEFEDCEFKNLRQFKTAWKKEVER
jgi:hypothetical protein